ncbi:2-dehydro-3-deoxygalactonokinase [Parapedobacter luteus]|uniref:2-dehydro-3-deoxygalactonokinase n=1 Tax=Parapedobacter luteus TaxID=623280 RepID=A0A1T5AGP9_9SPHI|nr:2-dehydro-3-deoxygalactonokinase [Parapedobacter luteus]SKB33813.1 2-dehydro-3-deoxygalactonokinase [Parapedobacter luteus]
MEKFLSCDWGTSRFRLRLVQVADLRVLATITHGRGIVDTFNSWKAQKGQRSSRKAFYVNVLKEAVTELSQKSGITLDGIPIVLSGMASATVGLAELPYKMLPFRLDGTDLLVETMDAQGLEHRLILISGVKTDRDVMRGEETKVLGCASVLDGREEKQLLILPGTHPKHIWVMGGQAMAFETYMTGEFFELLTRHSILSASVTAGADVSDSMSRDYFREGVRTSQSFDLLHAAFMTRTNEVLRHVPKAANFYYLSGVLIGAELRGISADVPICLVGGPKHNPLYEWALSELGVPVAKTMDADEALIKGQQLIFSAQNFINQL